MYEKFPTYFDGDFEDKEEEEQLKKIVKNSHMPYGWHTILLLSGEEDLDILHNWEHQLRLWVWRQNWNSLLPLIDNDMFEV